MLIAEGARGQRHKLDTHLPPHERGHGERDYTDAERASIHSENARVLLSCLRGFVGTDQEAADHLNVMRAWSRTEGNTDPVPEVTEALHRAKHLPNVITAEMISEARG